MALPGGVLVDRVDRRRLMITIDWVHVGAMGVLATALLTGWSSIALLDGVPFVINAPRWLGDGDLPSLADHGRRRCRIQAPRRGLGRVFDRATVAEAYAEPALSSV